MMQEIDTGEKAKDLHYNNANQDSIYNDANQDSIHNDANQDSIHNDANQDSIYNDANKDSIHNDANKDSIHNDANKDSIHNDANKDSIYNDANKDSIYNDANKDSIYNDANKDSIYNDANQDSIYNDANKDSIYNDANQDSIHNDANKDSIYIEANGKIHDEEKNIEKKLVDNDIAEMISAAVSTDDDPTLPCLTFRYWVLSTFFTALGAAISVFYHFRVNNLNYSIFFVILASYIAGKWLEKILPNKLFRIRNWEFNLNPGPFNYKEHVCIAAAAAAGGSSAYAVDILSIQDLFYNTRVNFLIGFLLLISTQMLGYGFSLVYASMYNTLHGNISETNDRIRFFYTAFFAMFTWQFVPGYIFPWLISAALLCLIVPNNNVARILGSSHRGAGILDLSFDWNAIGQTFPLFTPWWSQVNHFIGVVLAIWIIAPLLYFNNVFDAQKFPFLSSRSFDKDGNIYKQRSVIDRQTGALNVTAYENYSPVYITAQYAACYCCYFIQITATLCHVILFHGKEIWNRYKKTREEEEKGDIHCKLMSVYPEVPNYWYIAIFFIMLTIAIILGYTTEANLPWWALLLSVSMAIIMLLPIGIIQAISNWHLGLNVITELVCGFILPGNPIGNVYFKTYGHISLTQCLLFIQDLKL
ncbi:9482_t:CDS:10, partial [Racocetra persica]